MAFNTQEDMTVGPDALRAAATGRWHIKVGWGSGAGPEERDPEPWGDLVDAHGCTIAPCGFVKDNNPDCPLHGPKAVQTPRQRHRVKDCPGAKA